MKALPEAIQKFIDYEMPDMGNDDRDQAFKLGVASLAASLVECMPAGLLFDAVQSVVYKYVNNELDNTDFEDDGQPSEMQEWHDFDPDC